jgi:hypothetical protein
MGDNATVAGTVPEALPAAIIIDGSKTKAIVPNRFSRSSPIKRAARPQLLNKFSIGVQKPGHRWVKGETRE